MSTPRSSRIIPNPSAAPAMTSGASPAKGTFGKYLPTSAPSSPSGTPIKSSEKLPKPTPAQTSVSELVARFGGRGTRPSPPLDGANGKANGGKLAPKDGEEDASKADGEVAAAAVVEGGEVDGSEGTTAVETPRTETSEQEGDAAVKDQKEEQEQAKEEDGEDEEETSKKDDDKHITPPNSTLVDALPSSIPATKVAEIEAASEISPDITAAQIPSSLPLKVVESSATPDSTTPPSDTKLSSDAPIDAPASSSVPSTAPITSSPLANTSITNDSTTPSAPSTPAPNDSSPNPDSKEESAPPKEDSSSSPSNPPGPHPLTRKHTMFFSDTSPTKSKKASNSSTSAASQYAHGLEPLFSCDTVESFAGSWKALRNMMASVVGSEEGLNGLKQDSNFHLFLDGINPMWEDPLNAKGGRLTISTPKGTLDQTFSLIVLLLIGSILEIDALPTEASHGMICGAVASRRARGDRVEIWLGGPDEPDRDWVQRLKEVLGRELGDASIIGGKYKKHF